jgi:serine/threonine protein kinase
MDWITDKLKVIFPELDFDNKYSKQHTLYNCIVFNVNSVYKFFERSYVTALGCFATELRVKNMCENSNFHIASHKGLRLYEISHDDRELKIVTDFKLMIPTLTYLVLVKTNIYEQGDVYDCVMNLDFEARKRGVMDIIAAVKEMHKNKLLHGDIKSKNVFVSKTNEFYLGDFDFTSDWRFVKATDEEGLQFGVGTRGYSPWPLEEYDPDNHCVCLSDFKEAKMYDYFSLFVFICEVLFMNKHWAYSKLEEIKYFQTNVLGLPKHFMEKYFRKGVRDNRKKPNTQQQMVDLKSVGVLLIMKHDKVLFEDTFKKLMLCLQTDMEDDEYLDYVTDIVDMCEGPRKDAVTGFESLAEFARKKPYRLLLRYYTTLSDRKTYVLTYELNIYVVSKDKQKLSCSLNDDTVKIVCDWGVVFCGCEPLDQDGTYIHRDSKTKFTIEVVEEKQILS